MFYNRTGAEKSDHILDEHKDFLHQEETIDAEILWRLQEADG